MKRSPIGRASAAQRAKVRAEGSCRYCGQVANLTPAHITPRANGGCDDPLCVIPLCAHECHRRYDTGALDVLGILTLPEQAHAVSHLGIERARWRLTNQRPLGVDV